MSAAVDIRQEDIDTYLEFAVSCERDPVRWIEHAYPWGMKGTVLEDVVPHDWQLETADKIGTRLQAMHKGDMPEMPIELATASGHGIGKSAAVAMLNDWNISTLRGARGLTTANTLDQLTSKTWAEMAKWHNMSISRPFFSWTATRLFSTEPNAKKNWSAEAAPWSETNYEAFQGLHNRGRRILIQFDEASNIPRIIWELIEGAKTDEGTQIIHLAYGNPTRNSGAFYECFGKKKRRWITQRIDSRSVPGTNKALFKEWEEDHGEDSDFFRIRVRGVFPKASAEQFIPTPWVDEAMGRDPFMLADDPLICGIDFARSGSCASVMYWRRGRDAKTHKPDIYHDDPDTEDFIAKCVTRLNDMRPDVIFGDADGLGGPLCDRLRGLGFPVIDVQSGSASEFPEQNRNKRADMWQKGKIWIRDGGALWDNEDFKSELTVLENVKNPKGLLQMESKDSLLKRGEASPDIADAFMLTHAYETTELLSAEHVNDMQGDRAIDDYDQWENTQVSDDYDDESDQRLRNLKQRMHYRSGDDAGRF